VNLFLLPLFTDRSLQGVGDSDQLPGVYSDLATRGSRLRLPCFISDNSTNTQPSWALAQPFPLRRA